MGSVTIDSVWLPFLVEIPLAIFHTSVIVLVCKQMAKKNAEFTSGFFAIYVFQSVNDLLNYLWAVVYFRFPHFGVLPRLVMEAPFVNIVMFLMTYQLYLLFFTHMAIALNRYTAFKHPILHHRIWRGKSLKIMIIVVALFPLPGASLRFFYDTYLIEDTATPFGYMLKISPTLASQTGNFVAMAYSFITCMFTLYLELRTYWAYKKMSAHMRAKHRKDFRLLIYAMLTFFGQFLWTLFSLSNFLVYLTKDTRFSSPLGGPVTHSTIVDIICLTGSVCLFSTSEVVRRKYMRFYGLRSNSSTSDVTTVSVTQTTLTRRAVRASNNSFS